MRTFWPSRSPATTCSQKYAKCSIGDNLPVQRVGLKRLQLILIGCTMLGALMPGLVAQPRESFVVGVLRRDGVLLPFASYDGKWELSWPTSVRDMELPITLDAVPKRWWGGDMPQSWTLWLPDGSAPVKLVPSAPIAIIVGVEKRLGLRTGFVSNEPVPMPFTVPYPKEGIAISGDVKVTQISTVSKRAAAFRDLSTSLKDDIDGAEERAVDKTRASSRWVHPIPASQRKATTAELEAWYTSVLVQPGFGVSYIEAVKKYPPGEEDEGCGLETFISGWIYSNTRQPRPKTTLTARITYCDRNGVTYMLPLANITVNNRTHWVFQMSSWETEWYSVVEATPGRVRFVAEYFGGGRPSF
jgi:hypothetical protein